MCQWGEGRGRGSGEVGEGRGRGGGVAGEGQWRSGGVAGRSGGVAGEGRGLTFGLVLGAVPILCFRLCLTNRHGY